MTVSPLLIRTCPTSTPAPGTHEALSRGCWCPYHENERGYGFRHVPGLYLIAASCPLHALVRREKVA